MHNESMYDHTSYNHEMISQNTNTSVTPLPPGTEAVYRITCMDVRTRGGGQGSQNHCGNATYRKLVNLNKELYATTSKHDKLKVSKAIVAAIRKLGGRFLQAGVGGEDKGYLDIGDKMAWDKTSQALREGQAEIKAELEAEQDTSLGVQKVAEFQQVISTETFLDYASKILASLYDSSDFDLSHSCGPSCPHARRRAGLNVEDDTALPKKQQNYGKNSTDRAFGESKISSEDTITSMDFSIHSDTTAIGQMLCNDVDMNSDDMNERITEIIHKKSQELVRIETLETFKDSSVFQEDSLGDLQFDSERQESNGRISSRGDSLMNDSLITMDEKNEEPESNSKSHSRFNLTASVAMDIGRLQTGAPTIAPVKSASEISKITDPVFLNAIATHEEVMASGLPASPIDFPSPTFSNANRVNACVYNPLVDDEIIVPNIIYEVTPDGQPPKRAYWIGRELRKAIYGCVCSCSILKVREGGWAGPGGNSLWELTDELAAVKIIDLEVIRNKRKEKSAEDPIKEVAAMQYISREGPQPNVLPCWDVFKDEQYVYMCMPLCSRGELFEYVKWNGRFDESVAKYWFKQLLSGLISLQKSGIAHRDLSLENILIDENTHALVIDLGMCLRVPFSSPALSSIALCDSKSGTLRLPLPPQGICGKPNFIAPEVLSNDVPFDGFAIDLWAAGIILFTMLVGVSPFSWADTDDAKFRLVSQGGLDLLLKKWNRPISPDAANLLQSMLMFNPRDRLTLYQVVNHPWCTPVDDINGHADGSENGYSTSSASRISELIERMSPPVVLSGISDGELSDESMKECD